MENKKLNLKELTDLYLEDPEKFRGYLSQISSEELFNYGIKYLERAKKNALEAKSLLLESKEEFKLTNFEKKFKYFPKINNN